MIMTTTSTTWSCILIPFLSHLALSSPPSPPSIIPNPIGPPILGLLENPTTLPRANISPKTTKATGTGCRIPVDRLGLPPAEAVITTTKPQDNTQVLLFSYTANSYNLYTDLDVPGYGTVPRGSSKYCNGSVVLTYPEGWAFKLEGVTYQLTSRLDKSSGIEAALVSSFTLTPGTGTGIGSVVSVTNGSGSASITHKWTHTGVGISTGRYWSLAEMIASQQAQVAGGPVPVLSSICGQEGKDNTVTVGIDTKVSLQTRGTETKTKKVRGVSGIDDDEVPDFSLFIVRLHIRWEACR